MKNLIFRIMAFLCVVFGVGNLLSCRQEQDVLTSGKNTSSSLTFTLSFPRGGEIVYPKTKSLIHDNAEWNLESLWLYVFDATTGNKVGSRKNIKNDLRNISDATWTYVYNNDPTEVGIYRFVFVANEDPGDVADEATLRAKLASKTLVVGNSSHDLLNKFGSVEAIPMTGYAYQGVKSATDIALAGSVKGAKVDLTRIVARVDIESIRVPNLVIKKITLNNVNSKSYLFPDLENGIPTYKVPSLSERLSGITGFAAVDPTVGITTGGRLQKAAYLYEGSQPEGGKIEDYTSIVLDATLAGRPISISIPFVKSDNQNIPVQIKRNHIYRIKIGDDTPLTENSKVKFTIEDIPWNGVLVNDTWEPIRVEAVLNDFRLKWDGIKKELYLKGPFIQNTTEKQTHYVVVSSNITSHSKFEVTPLSATWYTAELQDGKSSNEAKIKIMLKDNIEDGKENSQVFTVKSLNAAGEVLATTTFTLIQTNDFEDSAPSNG